MQKQSYKSLSDWEWVRKAIADDLPVPYDPEENLYDPNDEAAVEAFFNNAKVSMPNLHMLQEIKKSA